MKIKDLTQFLDRIAPPQFQENYDNAGLIVGNPTAEITGVLVCLDSTESVVAEAVERGCNVVVAHHPIIFRGLKRLTGKTYVERTIIAAIKNDVAIFATHTNLDSVLRSGVNGKICEKLGLQNPKILAPKKQTLMKLTTFCPISANNKVLSALYAAGAGQIGDYKNCSFRTEGVGSFTPTGAANPTIGARDQAEEVAETRLEVILPAHLEAKILAALRAAHPYEEVAYYLQTLENENLEVGSGMIGTLHEPMNALDFLEFVKKQMNAGVVKFTDPLSKMVEKVAVCGGSGGFLLQNAIAAGADVFVTSDYKYHEFFDADGKIIIADIGHFESEQFTIDLLEKLLKDEFQNLTVFPTKTRTNPVNYL